MSGPLPVTLTLTPECYIGYIHDMYSTAFWTSTITPTIALDAQSLNGVPASQFVTNAQANQRNIMEVTSGNTAGTQTVTCIAEHLNKMLIWTPASTLSGKYQLTTAPFDTDGVNPEIEIFNNSSNQSIQIVLPTTTPASVLLSQWGYTRISPQGTAVIKFRRNNAGSYEFVLIGALTNINL